MALGHDDLTDRDALAGEEVQALPALHHPAPVVELPVDQDAGALLGRELAFLAHDGAPLQPIAPGSEPPSPLAGCTWLIDSCACL